MNLVGAVKTRLSEIAAEVEGIKRAYAQSPQTLPGADLPAIVCFTGPVVNSIRLGESILEETRKFSLRLYATQIQSGYAGDAERLVEPFLGSVRDEFLKHPGLGTGSDGSAIKYVQKMSWIGDGGVMVLNFAGEPYLGTEFSLNVTSMVAIPIAEYE